MSLDAAAKNITAAVSPADLFALFLADWFALLLRLFKDTLLVIYYDLFIKIEIKNLTNNPNLEKENFDNYIIDPKKDIGS